MKITRITISMENDRYLRQYLTYIGFLYARIDTGWWQCASIMEMEKPKMSSNFLKKLLESYDSKNK
jgi:hypothetical protein